MGILGAAKVRIIAGIFLAFLAANVLGVACLAHCGVGYDNGLEQAGSIEDLSRSSDHCDRTSDSDPEVDKSNAASNIEGCCFFASTLVPAAQRYSADPHTSFLTPSTSTTSVSMFFPVANARETVFKQVYKPPPQDRRISIELNCVIRI